MPTSPNQSIYVPIGGSDKALSKTPFKYNCYQGR